MNSNQLFHRSNAAGVIALLSLLSAAAAIFVALSTLPEKAFTAWFVLTIGLLAMMLGISLIFEAIHFARNGNSAARDEWEAMHKL